MEGKCGGPEHTTVRYWTPPRSDVSKGHGVVAFKSTHSVHSLNPEDELSTCLRNVGYHLMTKSYIQKDPRVPNQTAVRALNLAIHDIIVKQKSSKNTWVGKATAEGEQNSRT